MRVGDEVWVAAKILAIHEDDEGVASYAVEAQAGRGPANPHFHMPAGYVREIHELHPGLHVAEAATDVATDAPRDSD